MTDDKTQMNSIEDILDSHFKQERENAPAMDNSFFERMAASAAQMNPEKSHAVVDNNTLVQRFLEMINGFEGWRGASVLTASAVFGIMLGYAGPDSFSNLPVLSQLSESLVLDLDGAIDDFDTGVFDLVLVEG